MAQHPVSFRWDARFLERVDAARGRRELRTEYVRTAVEIRMALEGHDEFLWNQRTRRVIRRLAERVDKWEASGQWPPR
jgi:hypothetical protein